VGLKIGPIRWELEATDYEVPMSLHTNHHRETILTVAGRSRRLSTEELDHLILVAKLISLRTEEQS
jgi:hypothetical protein